VWARDAALTLLEPYLSFVAVLAGSTWPPAGFCCVAGRAEDTGGIQSCWGLGVVLGLVMGTTSHRGVRMPGFAPFMPFAPVVMLPVLALVSTVSFRG
jgi:hypothetical protein